MKEAAQHPKKKSGFEMASVISSVLGYERYARLMALLFIFGLLLGLGYYVYKRGVYASRTLLRVYAYTDSSAEAAGKRSTSPQALRQIVWRMESRNFILMTARRLGIAGKETSYEDVRANFLPGITFSILDEGHIQMDVNSYDADVVETYPDASLEQFYAWRVEQRSAFREKAVARYLGELEDVRKKLNTRLDKRLEFEEETALAEAKIELNNLSRLPVEMVRVRYQLKEMDRVRDLLGRWDSRLDTVGKLSLLNSFEKQKEDSLVPGRVLRPTERKSGVATVGAAPIVVRPGMIEGLEKWESLEKEKRRLQNAIGESARKFLDDHPVMVGLKENLGEVDRGLELELDVAKNAFELEFTRLEEQLADFEKNLPQYYEATRKFDKTSLDYDLLEGNRMAWSRAYDALTAEIETMEFNADRENLELENLGFTRLRNDDPVSPSKKSITILGLGLGLALAVGFPFLLMRTSTTHSAIGDLESRLGISGIGVVGLSERHELEEVNRAPTVGSTVPNAMLESFRVIRSGILLHPRPGAKVPPQVIMVTSARPGEGKTTLAANIAWAFNSIGERTLLMDCDLRRGRLHAFCQVDNAPGMTNLLLDNCTSEEAILPTQAENLFVIPRGSIIPGTTELFNSPRFASLILRWKGEFDRIVFDCPPVLGLSEASLIQSFADGVVVVVRSEKTPSKDIENAVETLEKLGAHIFGFVLNGVDFNQRRNLYNYYYYSSHYYEDAWAEMRERSELKTPQEKGAIEG